MLSKFAGRSAFVRHGSLFRVAALSTARAEAQQQVAEQRVPTLDRFMRLEAKKKERRRLDVYPTTEFETTLSQHNMTLERTRTKVLQCNIGLYCNQSCNHCHVESSPERTEMMGKDVVDRLLHWLKTSPTVDWLDITGGAPELNDHFRYLVSEARKIRPTVEELTIIDRCNLTCLYEPGQEDLKEFLAEHKCKIIASLPCYSKKNVNRQRGKGVFDKSIQALIDLNSVGYGIPGSGLEMDLVYNPGGASLSPPAESLEPDYKRELMEHFGIQFNQLHAFNNLPIKRFADFLHRRGELGEYMNLLAQNFNAATVEGLMCRNTVNVSWSGHVFDCDFNQMMEMETSAVPANGALEQGVDGATVFDFDSLDEFDGQKIAIGQHCYGCTAGSGTKCGT